MRRKKFGQILLLMLALWWVLTGSADAFFGRGWYIGLPMALLASWVAVIARSPNSAKFISAIQWRGIPQFMAFFLSRSLLAGIDVAKRTLSPSMPLQPGFYDYQFRLPEGGPQYFFMLLVSLLPGTLSVATLPTQQATNQQGITLRLHVLDTALNIADDCAATERVVARLFGAVLAEQEAESNGGTHG